MKLGFFSPEVPGHLNPMLTLAGELTRRGHETIFVGAIRGEQTVRQAGLPFHPLMPNDPRNEDLEDAFRQLATASGMTAVARTGKIYEIHTQMTVDEVPRVLDQLQFDGLVVDQMSPVAASEADRRGLPYAVVCNALPVHWDAAIPPPPMAWDFRTDWLGRTRNKLFMRMLATLNDLAVWRRGLPDPMLLIREVERGVVRIAQQPAFFEYPHDTQASKLHYTAPWHRADRDDATIDFPWDWLDGRPLIYASMGTLQNNMGYVFDAIVEAARDLPVQVVLTQGGGEVEVSAEIPDNVLFVRRAPQLRLLEKATLAITHAGMNTAMECLAHGVPMLCLPVTNDQPGVAKRVEFHGNGRLVPVRKVTSAKLKQELTRMLQDESFKQKASQFQAQLAQLDGPAMAADLIEQAIESSRKFG
ncbi:glycosyltransferase [Blastopirellula marina]|uniref:Glycosyl transferase family 1 n=1 Tax=Blastopirellula marina TaxID=124 RepID=A0A2S8GKG6_9BACT|nr:nucleotide disphospho-sugar-binding domain-containing protein [Blastopirellula marina]PQO44880.1 glycosyl transferase family 1 [Blastopirellula marina]